MSWLTTVTIDTHKLLDVTAAAQYLLGKVLVHEIDGQRLAGRVVETEAYHQDDPAAHTHRGQTERNRAMFGPPGHAYVYRSYGLHWCLNVTAGPVGEGAGVLLRAVEPLEGIAAMRQRRHGQPDSQLTNGPGKLAAAFGITLAQYGHDFTRPPLYILDAPETPAGQVIVAPRVGISLNAEALLRFYIKDNLYVSRI